MARLPFEVAAPVTQGIQMRTAPVDAAAVWERGAVVIDDGGGELTEGGANPTSIVGVANTKHPPTNNFSTDVGKHMPAIPGIQFEGSVDDSAAIDTGAIAATDLYAAYGITEDASGVWYVDKNKTAAADVRVKITKLLDVAGTVNGRVRFEFLQIVDLGGTPTSTTVYVGN